ncbi:hypothetical protein D3C73_1096340 [compost metagenome]
MSDAKRHYLEDDQPMTSELAKKHTKFDELMRELENDPAHREGLERARADVQAFFTELKRRHNFIEDRLRERLVDEFRENLEIKAPGPLAASTARALVGVVARMLQDPALYGEIPMSTETKVEM